MIGSDPAPAQRVNQVKAGGSNLCCAIVTRIEGEINVCVGVGCWWWMDGIGGRLEMPFNREEVEKCHQRKCHE